MCEVLNLYPVIEIRQGRMAVPALKREMLKQHIKNTYAGKCVEEEKSITGYCLSPMQAVQ